MFNLQRKEVGEKGWTGAVHILQRCYPLRETSRGERCLYFCPLLLTLFI